MTCRVESTSGAGGAQMHLERQRHLTGKFGKKGLLRPPPVRELPMLRRFIKREHCHGGGLPRPPFSEWFARKLITG